MGSVRSFLKSIYYSLPEEIIRLRKSYTYNKEDFANYMKNKVNKESENVFTDIYETNLWHTEESVSGGGSTMDATKTVRQEIPIILKKYNIKSMLDIPCGDYNWMKEVPKGDCVYIGGDIVEDIVQKNNELYASDKVSFKVINMTQDELPKVDLIFCKDCLQHLCYENVALALNNFKRSGAKYLLVSSFPRTWRNHDIYDGDYRPLNICIKPFNYPKPIYRFREKSIAEGVECDKDMFLYDLSMVPEIKL